MNGDLFDFWLRFGSVTGLFKPAPSPEPRQKPKILAPHRYLFYVKAPAAILALLVARSALGEPAATNITIHLAVQTNSVSWDASHKSLTFMCRATIDNQTRDPLTVSNLFQDHAGLPLKVADTNGVELARLYSPPFHFPAFTILAGSKESFWPYYGIINRFSVPAGDKSVRIQLEGNLIGSGYDGSLTSNIVELRIP